MASSVLLMVLIVAARAFVELVIQATCLPARLTGLRSLTRRTTQHGVDTPALEGREAGMAGMVRKSLDSPEETRAFEAGMGKLELVNMEGGPIGRATFQPGWQWSKHVKPIANTDSCEAAHMGYFISGRMKIVMDDGEEMEF